MATPVVKSTPGGRSTVFQKPVSLRRGDPLPAALAPKKEEPPDTTIEVTGHLRPASRYWQMDEEEETVTEEQPSTREQEYVAFWTSRGRPEPEAREEFKKYDGGSASPSERIRLARERYAQEEAAAKDAALKARQEDPDLRRVPPHFFAYWERRNLSIEEQRAEAKRIPPHRLLPEEGKE